jgi:predicted DNA-binding transcriptional regulator AlpA
VTSRGRVAHLIDGQAGRDLLLTRSQVATMLGKSPATVARYEATGDLPAVRVGNGHPRYRESDVAQLVERGGDDGGS